GQKLGRAPNEAEVAAGLGITESELIRQKRDLQAAGLVAVQPHKVEQYEYSMTLDNAESKDELPDGQLARQEMREALNSAIRTLPTRYQKVISMYYREDCTMKEIGQERSEERRVGRE